jgi:hypothetical protein
VTWASSSKNRKEIPYEGKGRESYVPAHFTAFLVPVVAIVVAVAAVGVVLSIVAMAVAAVVLVVLVSNTFVFVVFVRFIFVAFCFVASGLHVGAVFDSLPGGSRKRLELGGSCL